MQLWLLILLIAAGYAVGALSPGYWLVRWCGGHDVRNTGSGGTGATNAGRVLGKRGFMLVLVLDLLKGAAIVLVARAVYALVMQTPLPTVWVYAIALAAVAGHIWPVWLGFRGGKGVAVLIGSWLVLPGSEGAMALLASLALALALWLPMRRSFKMAWLASLVALPCWAGGRLYAWGPAIIAGVAVLILWWAHRHNMKQFMASHGHISTSAPLSKP